MPIRSLGPRSFACRRDNPSAPLAAVQPCFMRFGHVLAADVDICGRPLHAQPQARDNCVKRRWATRPGTGVTLLTDRRRTRYPAVDGAARRRDGQAVLPRRRCRRPRRLRFGLFSWSAPSELPRPSRSRGVRRSRRFNPANAVRLRCTTRRTPPWSDDARPTGTADQAETTIRTALPAASIVEVRAALMPPAVLHLILDPARHARPRCRSSRRSASRRRRAATRLVSVVLMPEFMG